MTDTGDPFSPAQMVGYAATLLSLSAYAFSTTDFSSCGGHLSTPLWDEAGKLLHTRSGLVNVRDEIWLLLYCCLNSRLRIFPVAFIGK